jgi:hypothetical protein
MDWRERIQLINTTSVELQREAMGAEYDSDDCEELERAINLLARCARLIRERATQPVSDSSSSTTV